MKPGRFQHHPHQFVPWTFLPGEMQQASSPSALVERISTLSLTRHQVQSGVGEGVTEQQQQARERLRESLV